MTPTGIERLQRQLKDMEAQLPQAIETMAYALSLGDFSENAEYTDAKARLSRLHGRIFSIKDRLRRAQAVSAVPDGTVQLGSTVVISSAKGKEKTYHLVSPNEINPTKGYISSQSPLGKALLGKRAGESVVVKTEHGETPYTVIEATPLTSE